LDTLNGDRNLATKNGLLKRQAKEDEEADIEEACGVCQPLEPHHVSPPPPSTSNAHVLIYPMAKERKKQALREVAVSLVIWKERSAVDEDPPDSFEQAWASNGQSKTLLIKRPEKGVSGTVLLSLPYIYILIWFLIFFCGANCGGLESCRIVGWVVGIPIGGFGDE
jgi:hypothetical protein